MSVSIDRSLTLETAPAANTAPEALRAATGGIDDKSSTFSVSVVAYATNALQALLDCTLQTFLFE